MAYPGIYRAKAVAVSGTQLSAYIPQVFGDVLVTVENFVGDPPTSSVMGWVSFQGGSPEFPVWYGGSPAGTGTGNGNGGGGGGDGLTVAQADLRYLLLAGGTLTGPLVLPETAPATNNHATTKGYVDSQVSTRLTQADADTRYVNVAGDTMTGPLFLPGVPTLDLHAATKSYVDTNIASGAVPATRSVLTTAPLTGGGDLTTNRTLAISTATEAARGAVQLASVAEANVGTDTTKAVTPLGAAQRVPLSRLISTTAPLTGGGDLTANRTLDISTFTAAVKGAVPPPTTVTGKYLKDDGTWAVPPGTGLTQATADPLYINVGGDTMTGPLVLPADPTLPLQATTKQYVDNRLSQADALYLNITGDAMTAGDLALFRDPSLNLHAATKQYVDAQRDTRQPLDADLTTIAGLTATTGNMILSAGSAWTSAPPVTVKTALALNNVDNTTDANKPVSTAQAAANALRLLKAGDTMTGGDLVLFRDPTSGLHAAPKQYVDTKTTASDLAERSKGGGLVVNGTGLLGNNTNFSSLTFAPADHPPGTVGGFLAPVGQYQVVFSDEFLPVNPSNNYVLGCWARETNPAAVNSHLYTGIAPFDAANNQVLPQQVAWQPNTTTTLAVALNPGNTTITLTSAANWNNAAGANGHYRGIVVWNYVDPLGYAWPVETYSRNSWLDIYNDGAISGNVITLKVPWAGPAISAGTSLSNSTSGGTFMYGAWLANATPTTWTWRDNKTNPYGGINTGGAIPTTAFPQGTVKVKLVILFNYGSPQSRNVIAGVYFEEYSHNHKPSEIVDVYNQPNQEVIYRGLTLNRGGSAGSPTAQIALNYTGANYPHAILTEHHATQNSGNKLHFRLWKVTDPLTGPSTNNVLTLAGDLVTAYYPIALPADPGSPLHAATKQYVDTHLTQAEADPLYVNVGGDTMTGTLNMATGSLNITAGQLLFGSRSGSHILLSSTDHVIGVQGPSGGGQDTVYSRSPNAFYWYRGGVHDAVRGTPGLGGVALLAMSDTLFTYKGSKIWTAADNGHKADSTGINADRLDDQHADYFANQEEVEALLGDLLYVGLYDAEEYDTTDGTTVAATKPHPDWSGGPNVYRHGMYWVCNSSGTLDFIDSDASGRYEVGVDEEISIKNGDWVIATDPLFDPGVPGHDQGSDLALADMVFQFVPFSAETYVKNQILLHVAAEDPHAQYLRPEEADVVYAPKDHSHPGEIRQHIIEHMDVSDWPVTAWTWEAGTVTLAVPPKGGIDHNIQPLGSFSLFNVHPDFNYPAGDLDDSGHPTTRWKVLDVELEVDEDGAGQVRFSYAPTPTMSPAYTPGTKVLVSPPGQIHHDPHAQYLETKEADLLYAPEDHHHDERYEPKGEVEFHESKTDPHPQYLTEDEGNLLFLTETEGNLYYAPMGHTHPEVLEVHATDGAVSADIWVGDAQPTEAMGLAIGDIWIETPPIDLQAPTMHQLTVTNGASGFSVVVAWQPWDSSEAVTEISLERSTTGTWPGTQLTTDKNRTSFTDSGRAANTRYYYRILAKNTAGDGPYSTGDIVTKPSNPTVTADSTGYNNATATWAPTGVGTYTYDVWINNVLKLTDTSALSLGATGVVENTTYTFAVRAKSALSGLYSATISDAITTVNAAPLAPTSLADSAPTSSSLTLAWTASASADRKDYQVYRGTTNPPTTYVATTAATSYTFTGLSSSTLYYLSVRTRDTRDAVSALAPAVNGSTAAPADTTPPTAPTIQSFQPQTTYGTMVLNATLGTGTEEYRIDSSTNNSTWTIEMNWTARGPGAIPARTIGTYAAGTTVYCRVYAKDDAGNITYKDATAYTIIISPTYITATATNHYRANGTWNAMGTNRPVQGFYSNSSYNATGCWFYGTKPNTTLYYGNRRTITSGNIWLKRMDGGDGVDRDITIRVHTDASQPAGAPGVQGTAVDIAANLPWNGAGKWVALPVGWADLLVTGSTYKGVALLKSTADNSTNYMTLANLSEDANSGKLQIYHLG